MPQSIRVMISDRLRLGLGAAPGMALVQAEIRSLDLEWTC